MVDDHHHHHFEDVSNDWSMVDDKNKNEDDFSSSIVFPPINHENLQLNNFSNHHHHHHRHHILPQSESESPLSTSEYDIWGDNDDDNSSSSFLLSSSSPTFDPRAPRKPTHFTGWFSIGLQIFRSKLHSAFSSFRNPSPSYRRRPIWSFGIRATVFVILAIVLFRWKKKKNPQSNLTPNETRLFNIIQEKDGKIAQLLNQIAQMNEILIDRHKALAAKKLK